MIGDCETCGKYSELVRNVYINKDVCSTCNTELNEDEGEYVPS